MQSRLDMLHEILCKCNVLNSKDLRNLLPITTLKKLYEIFPLNQKPKLSDKPIDISSPTTLLRASPFTDEYALDMQKDEFGFHYTKNLNPAKNMIKYGLGYYFLDSSCDYIEYFKRLMPHSYGTEYKDEFLLKASIDENANVVDIEKLKSKLEEHIPTNNQDIEIKPNNSKEQKLAIVSPLLHHQYNTTLAAAFFDYDGVKLDRTKTGLSPNPIKRTESIITNRGVLTIERHR